MKQLAGIIVVLVLAAKLYAGIAITPEMLATQFIAAVNERSTEKQKAIVHLRCFANLSAVQKQFLDETLARDFRKTVTEKRTIKVKQLEGPGLPFGDMMEWPVKPTHQLEIEFSTGENSSTSIIRFIAKEKDQWFIIIPMLNAENLKRYEEKNKSQPVAPPDKK